MEYPFDGQALGISKATVQRVWSTNDIKPHRTRIFKLSCDEQFEAKFWDVIGVYLDPPDNAVCSAAMRKASVRRCSVANPACPRPRPFSDSHSRLLPTWNGDPFCGTGLP